MYCAYCGNLLKEDDTFCGSCGRKRITPNEIKKKKIIILEDSTNKDNSVLLSNIGIVLLTLTSLVVLIVVLFGTYDLNDYISNQYRNIRDYKNISLSGINKYNGDIYLEDFGISDINDSYDYMYINGDYTKLDTIEGYSNPYNNLYDQDKFVLGFDNNELIFTNISMVFVGSDSLYKNIINELEIVGESFSIDKIDENILKEAYDDTYKIYLDNGYYVESEEYKYSSEEYNYFLTVTITKEIVNFDDIDNIDLYKINLVQIKK